MKPLNLDNRPCSPISSNCVVWQGPDISCINLCAGDTVSDVVAALATELCTILEQTNVSLYDLGCLGIGVGGVKDFQALIQLLIARICELENIPTSTSTGSSAGCPDCEVTVAPCFQTGTATTMQLTEYAQAIGTKVCTIIDQISDINANITDLTVRVEALETAGSGGGSGTLPSFTLDCQIGSYNVGSTNFINLILQEFINNVWCDFVSATGSTGSLLSAVNAICIQDTDLQLSTGTAFSTNPDWVQSASYSTVADAINNVWVALCDIYNYTSTIESTVLAAISIPTGAVMPFAGDDSTPPAGWLYCDGGTVSRTTYADLFTLVGTTYGVGNGTTTFNVPDLQQRVPVGKGTNAGGYTFDTVGATAGDVEITLTLAQIPAHIHSLVGNSFTGEANGTTDLGGAHNHRIWATDTNTAGTSSIDLTGTSGGWYDTGATSPSTVYVEEAAAHTHDLTNVPVTGTISGDTTDNAAQLLGQAHGNMQPYIVMNYIIKT